MSDVKYGLHDPDFDISGLNSLDYLSYSKVKHLRQSEWTFVAAYILGAKKKKTPAMIMGDLIHKALLQPEKFRSRFMIEPTFKGEGSRKAKDEWLKNVPRETILVDEDEAIRINKAINALMLHPRARSLLVKGVAERKLYVQDKRAGVDMIAIPDFLTDDGLIIDVKKVADASKEAFDKALFNYDYYIQAGIYTEALFHWTGKQHEQVVFVCVEDTFPFNVGVYMLDKASLDLGQTIYRIEADRYVTRLPVYKEAKLFTDQVRAEIEKVGDDFQARLKLEFDLEAYMRARFFSYNNGEIATTSLPNWAFNKLTAGEL